jgi:hypothetical protein
VCFVFVIDDDLWEAFIHIHIPEPHFYSLHFVLCFCYRWWFIGFHPYSHSRITFLFTSFCALFFVIDDDS